MFVGYVAPLYHIPRSCILWDTMTTLTSPHEKALTLLFAELEATATEQREAFLGTPGNLTQRRNESGTKFWVHRYSDAVGRRQETYLGTNDDQAVAARLESLRKRIEEANATIARVRVLARAGFATVDRKTYSTLATLHNHRLFRAGAVLIGSHAFGALLNALGVKTVPYATEDVDIARSEALGLAELPTFVDMLRETGIEFFEVPALNRRQHPTSFKEGGRSRLKVDLLVPSPGEGYPTIPVPELKAHAKGLPCLRYLPMELSWYACRSPNVMRSISSLSPSSAQKPAANPQRISVRPRHSLKRSSSGFPGLSRKRCPQFPGAPYGMFGVQQQRSRAICRLPLRPRGKR